MPTMGKLVTLRAALRATSAGGVTEAVVFVLELIFLVVMSGFGVRGAQRKGQMPKVRL